ncbi:MAG: hypothetical protein GX249_00150 [Firmicutes bacterium]|nr:hypothetical protein [Bacillota bacterium]
MLRVQVSLYPVEQLEIHDLRGLSTKFLNEHALDYDFQPSQTSFDTTITGEDDEVWTALRHLFQANLQDGHDVVMVTTITHWENTKKA